MSTEMITRTRRHFDHDLLDLHRSSVWLAETVKHTIRHATWAVLERDATAAHSVIAGDTAINAQRHAIEDQALELLARQQPLGRDLRAIVAYMAVASELERMGDYTKGMAKIALRLHDCPSLVPPPMLRSMAQMSERMLDQAMDSVAVRNTTSVDQLEKTDDKVDELYAELFDALAAVMREQPELIPPAILLLWAAHNLERLADRTINIGERAAFMAGGRRQGHT